MKVPILNLYYLLCYAWDMLTEGALVDVSHEPFRSLPELLARVLHTGVAHVLRRGLDRDYLREEEALRSPRGKIDLSATVKRSLKARSQVHCVYDTFSHDVLHNRIVRATLGRLARCEDLERRLRQESVRLYRRLQGIGDLDLTPAVFDRVVIHRNNRFYAFLIEVCRVLHQCLLVSQAPGQYRFRDFTALTFAKPLTWL
jgi:5-methylcytosine-specific restriction enzyme subunit McrC